MNEGTVKKLAERLDALAPESPADTEAWLDKAPITRELLGKFPEAREKVLAAVSAEPGDDFERARALWAALEEYPEATAALLEALKAAAAAEAGT